MVAEHDLQGTGTEASFADNFVVHYHPVSEGVGSQCHSKPYSGNLTTPRGYMNNTSALAVRRQSPVTHENPGYGSQERTRSTPSATT